MADRFIVERVQSPHMLKPVWALRKQYASTGNEVTIAFYKTRNAALVAAADASGNRAVIRRDLIRNG